MAGSQSFSGNGRLAIVEFDKKHLPLPVAHTRVSIEDAMLNEGVPATIIDGHEYDAEA